ncbi:hypothetical protein A3K73_06500 [Candidatus Pacearchaeota archaeon RBG_13_36_9]|nr:MAG: hypothetical protein A3K73_06500 [Candidatus Pacearchaeota archaeon RBG_13_36_9]
MNKKLVVGIVAIILVGGVLMLNNLIFGYRIDKENTDNIIMENNTVQLSSLTLRQKIAQMIMVRGDSKENLQLTDLNVGGVFLDRQESEGDYSELISKYQNSSRIKLLVSTDLEGAWNPFVKFKQFPKNEDIEGEEEAFQAGKEHGKLLKEMGFNMNFAPVSELEDEIYGGRAFSGDKEEIKGKLKRYIEGLQGSVFGVCKHYPGKGMIKNLHLEKDEQKIVKEDLELFEYCVENKITGIMVGHQVVEGEINSNGKPSSVSREVIETIPGDVLVISDEVNMQGLKNFYIFSKRKMYCDLINSGENLILDFSLDKKSAYKLILQLEQDVENGKIEEEKINESVKKILKLKGHEAV